jgi:hypothetical protein
MYAAQCYQACLDGVYAMIAGENQLKEILGNTINGDKHVIDIILKLYDIHSEYTILVK